MRRLKIIVVALIILALSGCRAAEKPLLSRRVSFTAADGVKLEGRFFGKGKTGLILAHMYPADQTSWFEFAKELADKGYTVLSFNFRGYGDSEGTKEIAKIDLDEAAAIKFMKRRGIERPFLIGASMGGTVSLKLAAQSDVAGVVSLSGPVEFQGLSVLKDISKVKSPKLFLAADDDPAGAADSARWLYNNSPEPKEIKLFPGQEHGTYLLTGESGEVKRAILNFLIKYK